MATSIAPRSKGISYQELIRGDAVPAPRTLTLENPFDEPLTTVPIRRYTTQAFHDLEVAKLWPKVWQFACREEEIADIGDYVVYEVGPYSIIVVRSNDGIKAHHNVCLHRGRKLCDHDGNARSFACPFHGFTWNLDGSLRHVPSRWDFPDVVDESLCLTPVQCDTWGGFVFVNMDLDAEPLLDFLGALPDHFECWRPEDRCIQAHVAKVIGCNWKVCQEAFMEAYHVVATHPQLLPGIGDENSQYDAWGNFSRAITPNGTPSPHLPWEPSEQDMFDAMTNRYLDASPVAEIPDGGTARALSAAASRARLQSLVGDGVTLADAELADSIYYSVFPNFHPWGAYNRIVYRFRPYRNRHDKSVMECYFLGPFRGERPAPAPMRWLEEDDDWTDAPELGMLARVFNQDCGNLAKVQEGLQAAVHDEVVLARYQETKIRHHHHLLGKYVNA